MYIITGHATLVDDVIYESPVNTLVETVSCTNEKFIFIRHFMNGERNSIAFLFNGTKIISTEEFPTISSIAFVRYFKEILYTLKFLKKWRHQDSIYFIGADPLNGLCGLIAKYSRLAKKNVFYSVDYSESRFTNSLANFIYYYIDKIVAKYSTQTWNVSSRIQKLHQLQNPSGNNNFLLPNLPSNLAEAYRGNIRNPYKLITLSQIDEQLDFISIINAVKDLKIEFPQIELHVYGNGKLLAHYQTYILENNLNNFIFFHGAVSHRLALESISKSGIGLAPYTGKWSFNFYGDSMKCREFLCFGLPIITTRNHSTADEITQFNAGIVLDSDNNSYINAVRQVLNNYAHMSKNSLDLHKKYEGIHLSFLKKLACN